MEFIEGIVSQMQFNRVRTLKLLDEMAADADAAAMLGFRVGPGRAPIGWQLMHIGVTEDLFASERLSPGKEGRFTELWPRFRGGSTPDDQPVAAATIREVLQASRADLLETLAGLEASQLDQIPAGWQERGLPLRDVLHIIVWHEAHHQGQAHLARNLLLAGRDA